MEQTSCELTPKQMGILTDLSHKTGKPVPALLDAALEALQTHEQLPETAHHTTSERPRKKKRLWEIAADLLADVPQEAFEKLPVDGAAQHNHYIYGTPKRMS
jgi:hypothetical protein